MVQHNTLFKIKKVKLDLVESISAGLDYYGISPLHCFLKDIKRARYTSASDEDALKAFQLVSKLENISPSLEPSHAFAEAIKIAPNLKIYRRDYCKQLRRQSKR